MNSEQHQVRPGFRLLRGMLGLIAMLCVAVIVFTGSLAAQENAESRAFKNAARAFGDKRFDRAERDFKQFVAAFPSSLMLPEAVLLQARSAMEQTNLLAAIVLLNQHLPKAGLISDQYRYWLAKAYYQNANFAAAADSFAAIGRQFPNSAILLEASHGEAQARFKLREFDRVVSLLREPSGAFQQSSKLRLADELTIRGHLLLAEALHEQRLFNPAEEEVRRLLARGLVPEFDWDARHLLCRILVAAGRPAEALTQTANLISLAATNLISVAGVPASAALTADSVALQASILRQLDRLDDAIQSYTNNLTESVPADRRRMAILNIIELKLAQDKTVEAEQMLQTFLARQPEDAASDMALLTSGELHLRLHFAGASASTNADTATSLLQQALVEFEKLAARTNSVLRGKALLNQGWCLWLDGRFAESGIAFRQATDALPYSEDLAMARFKLADCLYRGADYTNALALYRSVTNDFSGMPRVRESLFDQVLLQIVRASIQLGDESAAAGAMSLLLDQYPGSVAVERSMWLVSQDLLRSRQAAGARDVLIEFVKRFPGRPIVPKVELAIARSHMEQRDWTAAISAHEAWLQKHETNSLRPRAEFNRAWSYYRAGQLTNAFTYFTNFTARFPLEEQAPEAQYWVAGEFYRQKNFVEALRNFQIVVENTNWPTTRLTYQARMMAGRSAFAAQLWKNAEADFTALFNDVERCPVDIAAEAVFALGDTILRGDAGPRPENGAARSVDNYVEAKRAFEKLFLPVFATNAVAARLLPLAWGRIGDCSLQLAGQDSKQYDTATNAYWQVIQHRQSDIGIRSLAEFGIATAHEIQAADKSSADSTALLKVALDHYYNIAVGQNLRDSEESVPQWIERAGFAAARIAETLKQWPVAVEIYQRLLRIDTLASIRLRLEDKLQKARVQLGVSK